MSLVSSLVNVRSTYGRTARGARRLAEHLHPHLLSIDPDDGGAVGVVGGMQVHLAGEQPVVSIGLVREVGSGAALSAARSVGPLMAEVLRPACAPPRNR